MMCKLYDTSQVGPNLIVPGGCRVVDARGHYVMPGGIDPHTHMQLPFMGTRCVDDFYTGTKAALAGGTTTIIDYVVAPEMGILEAYKKWRSWADEKVCCDYSLHVAVTSFSDGVTDRDMETLVREKGVNSFKIFMAYKGTLQLPDQQMMKVFDVCKRIGAVPMVHAENGDLVDYLQKKMLKMGITGPEGNLQSRPEDVEAEATRRAITIADQIGVPLYVVHVMSKSAADEVVHAKNRGILVFGEALAAGLASDGTHVFNRCWRHAAAHVLSPPLRPDKTTPDYLMNLVGNGQLQVTGSDHCVFNNQQKALGQRDFTKIPNGVNGVEERMSIVWEKGVKTGKLTIPDFVAVTSSNAAKIFNMYPRKGRVAPGSDADIVVWGRNPKTISQDNHHSAVDFNIFEGIQTEFNPIVVISQGRIVLDEEGKLHVIQGVGRFIPGAPFPNIAFSRLIMRDLNQGPIKVDRTSSAADPKIELTPSKPVVAGDARNGSAAPRKSVEKELTVVTEPDGTRVVEGHVAGPPSPASSTGSMTPSGFHRIHTRSGVRSQQDSGFKLTGEQIDDEKGNRTSVKLHQPPGGKSSGIF